VKRFGAVVKGPDTSCHFAISPGKAVCKKFRWIREAGGLKWPLIGDRALIHAGQQRFKPVDEG
jgi:hypothetical protein